MAATSAGNAKVVKALLSKGADPSVQNQEGLTALAIARGKKNSKKDVIEMLARAEAAKSKEEKNSLSFLRFLN
jgi:ankyrin repeat protein